MNRNPKIIPVARDPVDIGRLARVLIELARIKRAEQRQVDRKRQLPEQEPEGAEVERHESEREQDDDHD